MLMRGDRRTQRTAKSSKALPSFAKWHRPPLEEALDPWDLKDEEYYLRSRAYHAISRKLDQAFNDTLTELSEIEEHIQTLDSLFVSRNPESTSEDTKEDTSTTISGYPRSLLAILLINGPCDRLDRYEWIRYFVTSSKAKHERTCTVWLQNDLYGSYKEELVRQCVRQEPEDLFQSRKKLVEMSLTDILVEWASNTQYFDRIYVYLETEGDFYGQDIAEFIKWMADRVQDDGIPFILIMLGPHSGRRSMELGPALRGTVGSIIHEFSLPDATKVLERFWEKAEGFVPFTLDSRSTSSISSAFSSIDQSVVQSILRVKILVAEFLRKPSSLLLVDDEEVTREKDRMRWFGLNSVARDILSEASTHHEYLAVKKKASEARALGRLSKKACETLRMKARGALDRSTRILLLKCLSSALSQDLSSGAREEVCKLIVLVDHVGTTGDAIRCFEPILNEWKDVTVKLGAVSDNSHWDIKYRSNLVRSLVHESGRPFHVGGVIAKAFLSIKDRTSLTKAEWFEEFRSIMPREMPLEEVHSLFCHGIYQLLFMTMARERTVANKGLVYDKATIVWCGGD